MRAATPNAADFIAAIVEAPEDEARWHVYADWLLDRNDRRGELINLTPLAESSDVGAAEARLRIHDIESIEERLVGSALREQLSSWLLTWRRGFIRNAKLVDVDALKVPLVVRALFADEHAVLLDAIHIDIPTADERLLSGACSDEISAGIKRLVRLRKLTVRGVAVRELTHPSLRQLVSDTASCPGCVTGRGELPELAELGWHLSDDGDPEFWKPTSIVKNPPAHLQELELYNCECETIDEIAHSGVHRQFRSLKLKFRVDENPLRELVRNAVVFSTLSRLAIDGWAPSLEDAEVHRLTAELAALAPNTQVYVPWRKFSISGGGW